jgi:cyclopropane fatty-acyl-phospholipid synthase-like methyltransferase
MTAGASWLSQPTEAASDRTGGLGDQDFACVARSGFGDPLNAYAHTMAWYRNRLYVGTTRANLCMAKAHDPPDVRFWPTRCPDDPYKLDLGAEIWCFDPRRRTWSCVLKSPLADDSPDVPRDIGYRGMAVFQASTDDEPALYVTGWSPSRSNRPATVLRSGDGFTFEPVRNPIVADSEFTTYRCLLPFDGRLFTTPAGRAHGCPNISEAPIILATEDPSGAKWHVVAADGFGDRSNAGIFELQAFGGCLYAGTVNPRHGMQVWKGRPGRRGGFHWTPVIVDGGYRGRRNEIAISMCVFNGALYVGTGIQNGGYDRANKLGPAGAELFRIHPDDSWELLIGVPRTTPEGVCRPLSGLGPGFGDLCNGYIWRMAVHEGCLYAGTYNWRCWLSFIHQDRWPPILRRLCHTDVSAGRVAGFDLWRSRDGVDWTPVTRTGFGNPYNYGARTLVSTPSGLFVGSANPFGPDTAREVEGEWEYRPNRMAGLEVWLGASRRGPAGNANGSLPARRARTVLERRDGWRSSNFLMLNRLYDERMYDELVNYYYNYSDFHNFGYWFPDTHSQDEACENLMNQLIKLIPTTGGNILDVACGKGASTRYLLNYYPASSITAINVSEQQLDTCKENAPHCSFLLMDAAKLDFPDASFNNIICVEAAFHFDTRRDFLKEAYRVLVPGGHLVLSDVLFPREKSSDWIGSYVPDNYVPSLRHYDGLLHSVGYRDVEVVDATGECSTAFCRHFWRFLQQEHDRGRFDPRQIHRSELGVRFSARQNRFYLLTAARKPV